MATPAVTIFPAASFPTCVTACAPLYEANGKCVGPGTPTAAPSVYEGCFCNEAALAPFKSGINGVCDAGCPQQADRSSIGSWYSSFCQGKALQTTTTTGPAGSSSTSASSKQNSNNGGGGGTWLSSHYQWVIFLVIMVVGIVGIWVGACIWRRRYLRKKDRQYALGRNLAHATESGRVVPNDSNAGSLHVPGATMFQPAPLSAARVYGDTEKPKKQKKKWVVKERT